MEYINREDAVNEIKFQKQRMVDFAEDHKTHLDKWTKEQVFNEVLSIAIAYFNSAIHALEDHLDTKERRLYEMREKALLDEISNIEGAKAETIKNAICKYLETRFGVKSQPLQDDVRAEDNLDTLNRIMEEVFRVNQLKKVRELIKEGR